MTLSHLPDLPVRSNSAVLPRGYLMLAAVIVAGTALFWTGIVSLGDAWVQPEYSHGPLIPVVSLFLFLRQLRGQARVQDPVSDRWPGFWVMLAAAALAVVGTLSRIPDIVTYGLILWIYGIVLVSFGWRRGAQFWPPVLHLAFMLPLPAILYWKLSIQLQFMSSEMGVALIRAAGVPVFLDGNIIDLGIYKLHVAEACSGLRYLFPVLSFSYIFAVLYQGPGWLKATLLLSAAPITIGMNALRIGIIGVMVDRFGIEYAEGFLHAFEGWVIFISCILLLFALAWLLQRLRGDRRRLMDALDLDVDGLGGQAARVRRLRLSVPMLASIGLALGLAMAVHLGPARSTALIERVPLALFPQQVGAWQADRPERLDPEIAAVLGADDYFGATFTKSDADASVDLFIAWYAKQTDGAGIHSPEVCLPAGGWEMSRITTTTISIQGQGPSASAFSVNRAVIQNGLQRKLVYYWFEQRGRRMTSDYAAKAVTVLDAMMLGRTDGGLVRIVTDLRSGEAPGEGDRRLRQFLSALNAHLPRFLPE